MEKTNKITLRAFIVAMMTVTAVLFMVEGFTIVQTMAPDNTIHVMTWIVIVGSLFIYAIGAYIATGNERYIRAHLRSRVYQEERKALFNNLLWGVGIMAGSLLPMFLIIIF